MGVIRNKMSKQGKLYSNTTKRSYHVKPKLDSLRKGFILDLLGDAFDELISGLITDAIHLIDHLLDASALVVARLFANAANHIFRFYCEVGRGERRRGLGFMRGPGGRGGRSQLVSGVCNKTPTTHEDAGKDYEENFFTAEKTWGQGRGGCDLRVAPGNCCLFGRADVHNKQRSEICRSSSTGRIVGTSPRTNATEGAEREENPPP